MSYKRFNLQLMILCVGLTCGVMAESRAFALEVLVTITNNAPTGGVALTPLWVGFHDGSFDSYDSGLSVQEGLERVAEDGNTSVIDTDFLGGFTYIDNSVGSPASATVASSQAGSERVAGTIASPSGPPPIQPRETSSQVFTISADSTNRWFSYAAMVIPSNDFFVANGNPLAHDLMSLFDGVGSVSFNIGVAGTVTDAGSETTDFETSAANGLFGLSGGQSGPNEGAAENGVVTTVVGDPFAGFGITVPSQFDFNNGSLYGSGIGTVTITAVPEPASALLFLSGLALSWLSRKAQRNNKN